MIITIILLAIVFLLYILYPQWIVFKRLIRWVERVLYESGRYKW